MTSLQIEPLDKSFLLSKNLHRAVKALREGKIILLLDGPDRENEGDLVVAAEMITKDSMNFLIKHGSGIVCLALPQTRIDELDLPLMIPANNNYFATAFTVSIEAKEGVTTGVSAQDRATTVRVAMAEGAKGSHLMRPGHVFPLAAKNGGVFERLGHTEGSVDLMRIAGLKPGAVLSELMNEDGFMAKSEERIRFATDFDIPVVSVEEILFYRIKNEPSLTKKSHNISSNFGRLSWHSFSLLGHEVDIFHKDEQALDTPLRLCHVNSSGLKQRFMAQVLEQSEDDPLVEALNALKEGRTDLVIMTSLDEKALEPVGEHAINRAIICRALNELSIKNIANIGNDHDFCRIAEHFFINVRI